MKYFSVPLSTLTLFPLLWISSCMDPMAGIKKDIKVFEETKSMNFYHRQGPTHPVRTAWSGRADKRPLLFIHGSPGSWKGWAKYLNDKKLGENFHLLAVDRPGYGGSGSGRPEGSLQNQAAHIVLALAENKSGLGAIVIGHSLGGPIAARLAMDFPDKVAGVIHVASSVSPELEKFKWYQYPLLYPPFRWLLPENWRVCNDELLPVKAELEKMRPRWKENQKLISILQGEKDNLVPPGNYHFLMEHLPASTVVDAQLLPDINHFLLWTKPQLIIRAIERMSARLQD